MMLLKGAKARPAKSLHNKNRFFIGILRLVRFPTLVIPFSITRYHLQQLGFPAAMYHNHLPDPLQLLLALFHSAEKFIMSTGAGLSKMFHQLEIIDLRYGVSIIHNRNRIPARPYHGLK